MLISLIICTLGERMFEFSRLIDSLKEQLFKNFEIIVVSQINHSDIATILENSELRYKHVRIEKKGLSLARNIGFMHVSGDFCTISDDDCWYPKDSLLKVSKFLTSTGNKVLTFKILDPIHEIPYKDNYSDNVQKLTRFTIGRVSSIELFFSTELIKGGLRFDEKFGLGAQYSAGEENIFLSDIIKRKYTIQYIPENIVYHLRPSKSKSKLTLVRMTTIFMTFLRMYGWIGIPLYYMFYIKHYFIIVDKLRALYPFFFI